MREVKVAEEQAVIEFGQWLDAMDLELSDDDGDEKAKVVRAIKYGDLTFNDDGEAVYTPWRPKSKHKDPITFRERSGATLLPAKGKSSGGMRDVYAAMAEITGLSAATFSGLSGSDIKTCEAVFTLLMA